MHVLNDKGKLRQVDCYFQYSWIFACNFAMGSSKSTLRENIFAKRTNSCRKRNNFASFVVEPVWERYLYEHQLKKESLGNPIACKLILLLDDLEKIIDKREECIAILARKLVDLGMEDFGELFVNHPTILAQFNPSTLARIFGDEPI